MVEGAALEMLCGETHPGFESLTLRQKNSTSFDLSNFFILAAGLVYHHALACISSTRRSRVVSHHTFGCVSKKLSQWWYATVAPLMIYKTKAKARRFHIKTIVLFWRKRWDSNPRYREVQLISSQSRYDHFDTLPCNVLRSLNDNIMYYNTFFQKMQ